jgi:hypothetical protein
MRCFCFCCDVGLSVHNQRETRRKQGDAPTERFIWMKKKPTKEKEREGENEGETNLPQRECKYEHSALCLTSKRERKKEQRLVCACFMSHSFDFLTF